MRSTLRVASPSQLRVSVLAFCAYGSACWRTARKHWTVSLDGAGVIAMNKWVNRLIAAIPVISGSMLRVGGPLFVLFLIVKLLKFFWHP
jgi:hypothetical protein